ncbi:MAG: 2OG-Fe(II) oxygenase [Thiotrichales bacterium]
MAREFGVERYNDILPTAKLKAIATEQAASYQTAAPFPHIYLDNLFPEAMLDAVAAEFPEPDDPSWFRFHNPREIKLASQGDERLGPNARALINNLNSGTFIAFLEQLTGIEGPIPDPHLEGGGMHQILPGGKLSVHIDFNRHTRLNLERRLNVLIYLNRDWDESYGGHFELWNREMTRSEVKILPLFNRMALFSTSEISWHGHPNPLTCPPGRSRRSIALYYYTVGRPEAERAAEHSTVFHDRPGESLFTDQPPLAERLRAVAKDWVPPAIARRIGRSG